MRGCLYVSMVNLLITAELRSLTLLVPDLILLSGHAPLLPAH